MFFITLKNEGREGQDKIKEKFKGIKTKERIKTDKSILKNNESNKGQNDVNINKTITDGGSTAPQNSCYQS